MSEVTIPNLQKEKIVELLTDNKRLDKREPAQYRDVEVKTNISKNAESSVSVKLGKTEVYAGVKLAVTTPYPDSPDEGTFMTTAELHPMASNSFEMGKPGINAVELARVIDRGIRESGYIDFKGLCIEEGEKVWQVFVDIVAVNDDGNVFDAAGLAAIIALGIAKMPKYNAEEERVEFELTDTPLPLNKDAMSVNMTFHKIGNKIVADPLVEEEAVSDYRLSIALSKTSNGPQINSMQKGKSGSISSEDLETILNIAEQTWNKLYKQVVEHTSK